MSNRIKFWLIFVLLYCLAFFAWWTYSLIDLSKEKYELELSNKELLAKQNCVLMRRTLFDKKSAEYPKDIIEEFAEKHCKGLELFWDTEGKPDLRVDAKTIKTNKSQIKRARNKYLMEGVSMFLLVAAGIIWIFISIGKILNLSKQQNNFLLSVSHEVKTPITAIQLAGQTLKNNIERLSLDKRSELLSMIDSNTHRLNALIDQMLIITRIEGAQYKYKKEDIELKSIINNVIENSSAGSQSHITVINKMTDNSFVVFDRLTLELCFSNLLENAIKYSPNGGLITISQNLKGGFTFIEITDQGVGIPNDEKKRVFEKFYRVGNEDTRTTKGTGLGLYLVKQILNRHKATIKVKDNLPSGSIFVIKLKTK